jgi:hypothetical protein
VEHVSLLVARSLSTVYSEYLLYEPIARIFQSKGFVVRCKSKTRNGTGGDYERIVFCVSVEEWQEIVLEIKRIKWRTQNFQNDIGKLKSGARSSGSVGYMIFFGKPSVVSKVEPLDSPRAEK